MVLSHTGDYGSKAGSCAQKVEQIFSNRIVERSISGINENRMFESDSTAVALPIAMDDMLPAEYNARKTRKPIFSAAATVSATAPLVAGATCVLLFDV